MDQHGAKMTPQGGPKPKMEPKAPKLIFHVEEVRPKAINKNKKTMSEKVGTRTPPRRRWANAKSIFVPIKEPKGLILEAFWEPKTIKSDGKQKHNSIPEKWRNSDGGIKKQLWKIN